MGGEQRAGINPLASRAAALLAGMQECNIALVRDVLRADEVKGVLRHYHSRRNAGTKRTLRLARGAEGCLTPWGCASASSARAR